MSSEPTRRPRAAHRAARRSAGQPSAHPGEIAYDESHDAIAALADALQAQERQERDDYARRLDAAITQRLNTLGLTVPVTVSVTPAPPQHSAEGLPGTYPTYFPTSPIDRAIEAAIDATPTPTTLPGTPLTRLADKQATDSRAHPSTPERFASVL